MKYSVALAALAAVVAAQSGSSPIPVCAQQCLADATTKASSCSLNDYACTCEASNKAAISSAATSCVIAACGVDTAINQVLPASDKLCAEAAAAASSAPASAPSAPAAASSASAAASSAAAAAPSSAPSSADGPACPAKTHVAACSAVPLPSIPSITTSHTPVTPTGNATATATPTVPVQAGAAGIAPVGGLAMLLVAALAI